MCFQILPRRNITVIGMTEVRRSIIKSAAKSRCNRAFSIPGHTAGHGKSSAVKRQLCFPGDENITHRKIKFKFLINRSNFNNTLFRDICHFLGEETNPANIFQKVINSVNNTPGSSAVDDNVLPDFADQIGIFFHPFPFQAFK